MTLDPNNKVVTFKQPAGLGDVTFLMGAANMFTANGFVVNFPVNASFVNIKKHFNHIANIFDVSVMDWNNAPNLIDFGDASTIVNGRYIHSACMRNKYDIIGVDWKNWRNFDIQWDVESENKLFYDFLGLSDGQEYVLINTNWGSGFDNDITIQGNWDCKVVKMFIHNEFTIFDWRKVFENAKEIHTVGTSVCYAIEKMELKGKIYKVYLRNDCQHSHSGHDYIFDKATDWE